MEEKQIPVQFQASPNLNYASNANLLFSEEEFVILITSGNQISRYAFTPKHMKRMSLLLERQIKEYEAKFGELKTKLPEAQKETTEKGGLGFRP